MSLNVTANGYLYLTIGSRFAVVGTPKLFMVRVFEFNLISLNWEDEFNEFNIHYKDNHILGLYVLYYRDDYVPKLVNSTND